MLNLNRGARLKGVNTYGERVEPTHRTQPYSEQTLEPIIHGDG